MRGFNDARIVAAALGVLMLASNARAIVAQVPLSGSSGSVPPNLMFTLDDSGSMDFECLPDALCVAGFRFIGAIPWGMGTFKNAVVTYNSDALLARQMRSDRNPLYYNPAVRYRPWLQADGTRLSPYPATAAPPDPRAATATVDLTTTQQVAGLWCRSLVLCGDGVTTEEFWPAQYYQLTSGAEGNQIKDYEQFLITSKGSYTKGKGRSDCVGEKCTGAEELQNFSNWFTYARSRLKVAIGGTAEAFADVPPTYRVGFGTTNSKGTQVDGKSTSTVRAAVRPFAGNDKKTFYALLQDATSKPDGTPLRRAMDDVGQYFSRTDSRSPWASDPAVGNPLSEHLGCRRSYHLLMTDGVWNGDGAPTPGAADDVDSVNGPVITHADQKKTGGYIAQRPYIGDGASTLADVAMFYWSRDLQPDVPNNVKDSESNPAFWQHMVNYTLAFGLNGDLKNDADRPALTSGNANWGKPAPNAEKANVDDLWHAALNSRGLSKSSASSAEYTKALKSIIQDIAGRSGGEAGVAVSSREYLPSERKYVASYDTSDWTGDLVALTLDTPGTKVWLASEKLPAAADRKIYTYDPIAARALPFQHAEMETAGLSARLGVSDPKRLIDYLRGDRTGEASTYRKRTKLLGDIVNSSPVLVKDLVDGQYDFLPLGTPEKQFYRRFLDSKKHRLPQLFAGANDGMLHAFNDGAGINKGAETFAFVPNAVLGDLMQLAQPSYVHRYFVDGPLMEVDVFDRAAAKWRNLILGGGGAGAKNLFAVNVPVPLAPAEGKTVPLDDAQSAPGAGDILWEISSGSADFAELGHVLRAPQAGILKDGRWAVLVGNGYDSGSGRAQLYVIDAISGARLAVFDTGAGSASAPNGLGGVKLLRNDMQQVVGAYAGDLQGNLWKFDLSSSTPSSWRIAFGGKPLFRALDASGQPEPITAAPTYARHPLGGVIVLAGSGKLFEQGDAEVMAQRSLYGVWDKVAIGAASDKSEDHALADLNSLVVQEMSPLPDGKFSTVSSNSVDYGSQPSARKRGWLLRMTGASGQRLIYDVSMVSGRVLFQAMTPGGSAQGCAVTTPRGARFLLDPFTGAPGRDGPTFDTNGDSSIDGADNPAAAVSHDSNGGTRGISYVRGSKTQARKTVCLVGKEDCTRASLETVSAKRQWRQIFTPPSY